MVMFSGMLYQRSSLPPLLSWCESLSIVNYGFSALLGLQVQTPCHHLQRTSLIDQEGCHPSPCQHENTEKRVPTAAAVFNRGALPTCKSTPSPT